MEMSSQSSANVHFTPFVLNFKFVFFSQTLLTIGRTIQDSVDEMGTRIYNALKKVTKFHLWRPGSLFFLVL